jgi:hypothetical protein
MGPSRHRASGWAETLGIDQRDHRAAVLAFRFGLAPADSGEQDFRFGLELILDGVTAANRRARARFT